jgi:hypothetical protein
MIVYNRVDSLCYMLRFFNRLRMKGARTEAHPVATRRGESIKREEEPSTFSFDNSGRLD